MTYIEHHAIEVCQQIDREWLRVLATEQLGEHAISDHEALLSIGGTVTGLQQPGQEDVEQWHLVRIVVERNFVLAGKEDVNHLRDTLHRCLVVERHGNVVDVAADVCHVLSVLPFTEHTPLT